MVSITDTLSSYDRVFVVGSGGVGKTTTAGAVAVALATDTSQRVLVVTVDPAKRLASALGVAPLGNSPVEIPLPKGAKGSLFGATVDMKRAWDSLVDRFAPDKEVARRIRANPIFHNLSSKFIGSYDYAAVEVLAELTSHSDYDLVVVDTPPSRHALNFLDAPAHLQEFFSSNLLKLLILPRRARWIDAASRPFYAIAGQILGSAFLEDLTDFFSDFALLGDGLVAQSRDFSRLLGSASTGFLTVSLPYGPSAGEAAHLLGELELRRFNQVGYLINRAWPPQYFDEDALGGLALLEGDPDYLLDKLEVEDETAKDVARRMILEVVAIYEELNETRKLEADAVKGVRIRSTFAVPILEGDLSCTQDLLAFYRAMEPV